MKRLVFVVVFTLLAFAGTVSAQEVSKIPWDITISGSPDLGALTVASIEKSSEATRKFSSWSGSSLEFQVFHGEKGFALSKKTLNGKQFIGAEVLRYKVFVGKESPVQLGLTFGAGGGLRAMRPQFVGRLEPTVAVRSHGIVTKFGGGLDFPRGRAINASVGLTF